MAYRWRDRVPEQDRRAADAAWRQDWEAVIRGMGCPKCGAEPGERCRGRHPGRSWCLARELAGDHHMWPLPDPDWW